MLVCFFAYQIKLELWISAKDIFTKNFSFFPSFFLGKRERLLFSHNRVETLKDSLHALNSIRNCLNSNLTVTNFYFSDSMKWPRIDIHDLKAFKFEFNTRNIKIGTYFFILPNKIGWYLNKHSDLKHVYGRAQVDGERKVKKSKHTENNT